MPQVSALSTEPDGFAQRMEAAESYLEVRGEDYVSRGSPSTRLCHSFDTLGTALIAEKTGILDALDEQFACVGSAQFQTLITEATLSRRAFIQGTMSLG